MAIYNRKQRNKEHAFEHCPPCQQKFFQPGADIRTNAKPLNTPSGSDGFVLGAKEKRLRESWTDHAFASTTDGNKRIGVEGMFSDDFAEEV